MSSICHCQTVQGPIENIAETEVKLQPGNMTENKARGPDEIPIELVKILKKNRDPVDEIMLEGG